jgi:hypothetical protein
LYFINKKYISLYNKCMRVVVEKLFLSQVLDTGDETLHGGIIHVL